MQLLFLFLYKYRAFFTFLFLELLCIWLIVQNNSYQGAKYFNSSNRFAASLLHTSDGISDYFTLGEVNQRLAEENAALRRKLEQYNQSVYDLNVRRRRDAQVIGKYDFIAAKVINNSTRRFDNYITINKGSKDGVTPDMAVIDGHGAVGKVKSVSRNFSVITSILHGDVLVSAKIKRTGDICTAKWDGLDPQKAELLYVPRHVDLQVGDTVTTSGYNAIFPEDVPVGYVEQFEVRDEALFYDVKISLATDLNQLSYVYLVKNNLKIEQDSVQNITIN